MIVIEDRDRQDLLCTLLSDNMFIEMLRKLCRGGASNVAAQGRPHDVLTSRGLFNHICSPAAAAEDIPE
jgi:hypothetical protein